MPGPPLPEAVHPRHRLRWGMGRIGGGPRPLPRRHRAGGRGSRQVSFDSRCDISRTVGKTPEKIRLRETAWIDMT